MPLPAVVTWGLPSLAALLAAWVVQKNGGINNININLPLFERREANVTWVIGDLHGDVECAKHWVRKTGLISKNGKGWIAPNSSHLVFLGDYVDKGPQSRQVVEYVKELTDAFPTQVTAIMGNHEIELLLDRDKTRWEQWGGVGYFGLAYSSVHPAEFLNYLQREITPEDDLVVEALYNASVEVYSRQMHQVMRMGSEEQVGKEKSMLQFITDDKLRAQVATRLEEYQTAYIDAYRSGTELGDWLERRPIIAQVHDTIFVHGGVSNYGSALLKQVGMDKANELFFENSNEEKIRPFITQTQIGQILYNMLTFRGNHQPNACPALANLLPEGANRLGVGHTPGKQVRLMCDGNFMAMDSSLGRWFRNSGNLYCHGKHKVSSKNGLEVCDKMNFKCEGQISKLTADGKVQLIQS